MASKLPWFKFYPSDWAVDPNLGRCSREARGFWIDALCVLHEAEEVGVFITNGIAWTDQEIAGAVRGDYEGNLRCLAEVLVKGVAARTKGGAVFSRRMVRDEEKRKKCVDAGLRGGNPTLKGTVNGGVKARVKPEVKLPSDSGFFQKPEEKEFSLSSEVLSENKKPENSQLDVAIERVTESLYSRHPVVRRCSRKEIEKRLRVIVKSVTGVPKKLDMLAQIDRRHAAWCESDQWQKDGGEFAKGLTNWLSPHTALFTEEAPGPSERRTDTQKFLDKYGSEEEYYATEG